MAKNHGAQVLQNGDLSHLYGAFFDKTTLQRCINDEIIPVQLTSV
ncbi:hypothetical protein [Duganella margarita]|nr:hypothetical protein [Duganella margarita]